MNGWEYCELTIGPDGALATFAVRGERAMLFWCGDGSPADAWSDQGENPVRIAVDPAQGPQAAAMEFLGGLGWELVAVLDRDPLLMYFKRTRA